MIRAFFMTHISRSPSGHGHTERIAPRWCRLAPHTRASACTRACTLYGCAARAPHGNDESSTLEHLASGPLSRYLCPAREFLSLPRWFSARRASRPRSPSHHRWFPRAGPSDSVGRTRASMWTYTCVHGPRGRVRAKRRPRSCHDFAFVYARSLSFGRDHLRHSRASRESPVRALAPALALARAAVGCWQICVAAGICFRFQWFMPANGSRARESVMPGVIDDSYRWDARVCFSEECDFQGN